MMPIFRAPERIPSGLKVTSRWRKLSSGLPLIVVAAGMLVDLRKRLASIEVSLIEIRECQVMQVAADHGLWFVALGDDDRMDTVFARGNPAVSANEIRVLCTQHHELGENGVVIF